jgi:hypothetical protein
MLVKEAVFSGREVFAKIVIETIDKIAPIGAVSLVRDEAKPVARAGDDLPVEVIRLELIWPGIRRQETRRQFIVGPCYTWSLPGEAGGYCLGSSSGCLVPWRGSPLEEAMLPG